VAWMMSNDYLVVILQPFYWHDIQKTDFTLTKKACFIRHVSVYIPFGLQNVQRRFVNADVHFDGNCLGKFRRAHLGRIDKRNSTRKEICHYVLVDAGICN
jgi:hypothetical protein